MENFIKEAKKIHGDRYDYSNLEYINSSIKVKIFCKTHNFLFEQSHSKHKSGQNCTKCSKRFMDTNYFKEKASRLHLYKYDYRESVYVDNNTKNIKIVCPDHGEFLQSANNHLRGQGCSECGKIRVKELKKITKFEFIERSQKKYGDLFDYSNINYIDYITPLNIICKEHASIEIIPRNHLIKSKYGCNECAKNISATNKKKYKTTFEMVKSANEIHCGKYDYSKTIYQDCDTDIIIICPIHHDFKQTPYSHINKKAGCQKCSSKELGLYKRKSLQNFISDAKEVHGEKYNYDKVIYTTCKEIVIITCQLEEHGDFPQVPSNHLAGSGCPICADESRVLNKTFTLEEFIQKAVFIHGDKYDYSNTVYIKSQENVKIRCPLHEEFEQLANNHLRGKGCRKCGDEYTGNIMRKTKETFLKESIEIHGDKYDYSDVEYINTHTDVKIICPEHGDFKQTPSSHISGSGCIKCGIIKRTVSQTFTQDQFINRAIEKHGNKFNYEKVIYINSSTKIMIICNSCNHNFDQQANGHLRGQGCPYCTNQKLCDDLECLICLNKSFASSDKAIFWSDKNGEVKPREVFKSTTKKYFFNCKKGHPFDISLSNITSGCWCRFCVNKTEQKVYEKLITYFPTLKQQFKAEWCKNKRFLPFDFVIDEYEIIIEVDGLQHFKQIWNWRSPKEQQKIDKYKMERANKNGYSFIRITQKDVWYDTYDWLSELVNNINWIIESKNRLNIFMCLKGEYSPFLVK